MSIVKTKLYGQDARHTFWKHVFSLKIYHLTIKKSVPDFSQGLRDFTEAWVTRLTV
jgi:hypothetical protein